MAIRQTPHATLRIDGDDRRIRRHVSGGGGEIGRPRIVDRGDFRDQQLGLFEVAGERDLSRRDQEVGSDRSAGEEQQAEDRN